MRKFLFFLLVFLLLPSAVYAGLPAYTWDVASARFNPATVVNSRAAFQAADLALLNQLARDGATITRPVSILGTAGGIAAADMYAVAGTGASAGILRSAVGLAGPVATLMMLGMTAKDLYDWANASPENKAYFNGISSGAKDLNNLHFDEEIVNGATYYYNGSYYILNDKYLNNDYFQDPGRPAPFGSGSYVYIYTGDFGTGTYGSNWKVYHQWRCTYQGTVQPPPPNAANGTVESFSQAIAADLARPDAERLIPNLKAGIDQAMKDSFADPAKVQTAPSTKDLADFGKIQTAIDANTAASQALADQLKTLQDQLKAAQDKLALTPTDPVLQAQIAELQRLLDQAIADKAAADKAKAEEEALIAPPVPSDNQYDGSVALPDKKSISDLLRSFFTASPLVSMVRSFSISTSSETPVVHIGNIYGKDLSFDFTPWQTIFSTTGGVLIIIMHGYAVLVVIRGW